MEQLSKKKVQKGSKYIKRLLYLLPAVFFLTFTLFIFAPNEIYILNSGEFLFSLKDIIQVIILYFIAATILLCVSGALIKSKKAFNIYNAVVLGLALGFYIQGNFLNNDYGVLDGSPIEWFWYKRRLVFGLAVWGLCISVPLAMNIFSKTKQIFFKYNRYLSASVTLIQVITLTVLMVNFSETSDKIILTNENLTTLSENKNAVVFILDSYGNDIFQQVLKEDDYNTQKVFKDFTYFNNCTSLLNYTTVVLPHLLTGIPYKNLERYYDYIEYSYKNTNFYDTLAKNNFSASIYTDGRFLPTFGYEIADNVKESTLKYTPNSVFSLTHKLYQLCFFRYFPQPLKFAFWLITDDFNEHITISGVVEYEVYPLNQIRKCDLIFYENIQETWLLQNQNSFKFYHLIGPHKPYFLGKDIYLKEGENVTAVDNGIGSLKIVEKYLDIMKGNKIWE